ncbi:MAG: GNAT family N-acetyltransferase [Atopobiaceae bacterium]|nr:GNAT family N-acetyltransferase [Atopobiaceae bacterium]
MLRLVHCKVNAARERPAMLIRFAIDDDLPGISSLLEQVLALHAEGRPDIFRAGTRKYTDAQILELIADDGRPLFVAVAEDAAPGELMGYAICKIEDYRASNNHQPIRTLYIDDFVVDEAARGRHVGSALFEYVKDWAREQGFYNVTLNVWECNPGARAFYEAMGMKVMKTEMEAIL